jgi:hypothetical protein
VLNKHVLTIGITSYLNSFAGLTVDNSLTLVLEDLPPLTIGSGDLQIG